MRFSSTEKWLIKYSVSSITWPGGSFSQSVSWAETTTISSESWVQHRKPPQSRFAPEDPLQTTSCHILAWLSREGIPGFHYSFLENSNYNELSPSLLPKPALELSLSAKALNFPTGFPCFYRKMNCFENRFFAYGHSCAAGESNSRLEDDYYIAVEQEPSSMAAVFHISPTCNRTGLSKQFFVSIRLCGINSLLAYRNCSQHAGFSPAFPFKNMP